MPGKSPYSLDKIVRWLRSDGPWRARGDAAGDPMLGGEPDSPALERYREERALLARYERMEREKQLIQRSQIHDILVQIASLVRGAGERIEREGGVECRAILDESLDGVAHLVGSLEEPEEEDDGSISGTIADPD